MFVIYAMMYITLWSDKKEPQPEDFPTKQFSKWKTFFGCIEFEMEKTNNHRMDMPFLYALFGKEFLNNRNKGNPYMIRHLWEFFWHKMCLTFLKVFQVKFGWIKWNNLIILRWKEFSCGFQQHAISILDDILWINFSHQLKRSEIKKTIQPSFERNTPQNHSFIAKPSPTITVNHQIHFNRKSRQVSKFSVDSIKINFPWKITWNPN